MSYINKHGLKMKGLAEAARMTREVDDTFLVADIYYDVENDEVISFKHMPDEFSAFRDRSVIRIGKYRYWQTQQMLADAIADSYHAYMEHQKPSGRVL